ncbi:hypothetical protein D9M71_805340 [compost metagenome]
MAQVMKVQVFHIRGFAGPVEILAHRVWHQREHSSINASRQRFNQRARANGKRNQATRAILGVLQQRMLGPDVLTPQAQQLTTAHRCFDCDFDDRRHLGMDFTCRLDHFL